MQHVVALCAAHTAARRVLVECLPAAISDLSRSGTIDALMGASTLRVLVPDNVTRIAAIDAFKLFLVRVFANRTALAAAVAAQ